MNRDELIDIVNGILKDHFDYVPLNTAIKVADALIEKEVVKMEREKMWVCDHCLAAIESREGNQATLRHFVDEDDDEESKCDWCEEVGFDTLYELV